MPVKHDLYAAPKAMGIFKAIGKHDFQNINAEEIVQRILSNRRLYEERQRLKSEKAAREEEARRREEDERERSRSYEQ